MAHVLCPWCGPRVFGLEVSCVACVTWRVAFNVLRDVARRTRLDTHLLSMRLRTTPPQPPFPSHPPTHPSDPSAPSLPPSQGAAQGTEKQKMVEGVHKEARTHNPNQRHALLHARQESKLTTHSSDHGERNPAEELNPNPTATERSTKRSGAGSAGRRGHGTRAKLPPHTAVSSLLRVSKS